MPLTTGRRAIDALMKRRALLTQEMGEGAFPREQLSSQHLTLAHDFEEAARVFEEPVRQNLTTQEKWQHRGDVTAAIMSATAYLEDLISELYVNMRNLPRPKLVKKLRASSTREAPKILNKYQLALSVSDGDPFDQGMSPFYDADSLFRLRDALVNYLNFRPVGRRGLHSRLDGKFPLNPYAPKEGRWFPDRCLGAGCAKWAVSTAEVFGDDFCRRMGIPARPRVNHAG
ncbi:MAG: hypothetical protein M3365_08740 [Gemmatimonadota bacterium]|nr:hypothetical protein [Gemmatimonadota bacterium]